MRPLVASLIIVLCSVGISAAAAMPGPQDNLYKTLQPIFQDVKTHAQDCDYGTELNVDLLSEQTVPGYLAGQVFGATACGRLPYNYSDLQKLFAAQGSIRQALGRVKTFGPLKILKEAGNSTYIQFEILVPITANYVVKSWIQFDVTDEIATLHWYQEDNESRLENNRGFLVIIPDGEDHTKVYLRSYHILKKEHRLRFPTSTFAPGFTRNHYGNYFRAVKDYAQELIP